MFDSLENVRTQDKFALLCFIIAKVFGIGTAFSLLANFADPGLRVITVTLMVLSGLFLLLTLMLCLWPKEESEC